MKKRAYKQPDIRVFSIELQQLIATSISSSDGIKSDSERDYGTDPNRSRRYSNYNEWEEDDSEFEEEF